MRPGLDESTMMRSAHQHRLLDVVRHHQDRFDRHPPFDPEIQKVGAQGLGGQDVEGGEGLVHQQDLRIDDERACEAHALAQCRRTVPSGRPDSNPSRPMRSIAASARLRASASGTLRGAKADLDVGENRQPGEQGETLEHHRQSVDRTGDRGVLVGHRAVRRKRETGDDPQQRGFPQPERPRSPTISPAVSFRET